MLKKILAFLLATTITLGSGITAFAAENHAENIMNVDEVISQLSATDYGIDITFSLLSEEAIEGQTLMKFDSIEEAEAYLKQLIAERSNLTMYNSTYMQDYQEPLQETLSEDAPTGWYTNTVSWWGGGNTSLFSMTNAKVQFYYYNGMAFSMSVLDSYMTGLVGASWTHKSGTVTSKGGTNAVVSVTGTWLIGVEIGGYPIGLSFDETITSGELSLWS